MDAKERSLLEEFGKAGPGWANAKSANEIREAMQKTAELMARSVSPRTMISKPIGEASILPPYGTILRNKNGEHAMYVCRDADPTSSKTVPGNMLVILDDVEPYAYACTDMQLLKQWQIVEETS